MTPGEGDLTDRLRAHGFATHIVPFRGYRATDLPRIAAALMRLRRLARQGDFDLVHAHLLKAIVMCRLALVGRSNPKLVSQVPGVVHLDMRLLRGIDVHTLRKDDLTVCSCTAFARTYESLGARRIAVNHYGMDTGAFLARLPQPGSRAPMGLADGDVVVVMVAHMYPTQARAYRDVGVKGHEIFIDAAQEAMRKDPRLCFLVVGDEFSGDGSYRAALEKRAAGMPPDRFRFLGHRTDIGELLAVADIAANPSLSESASYTVMEASLAGLPVVVSDVGGLTDTVIDGKTGLVVPPADRTALAAALLALAAAPTQRSSMGAQGRAHVQQTFDVMTTVSVLERHYDAVLESA